MYIESRIKYTVELLHLVHFMLWTWAPITWRGLTVIFTGPSFLQGPVVLPQQPSQTFELMAYNVILHTNLSNSLGPLFLSISLNVGSFPLRFSSMITKLWMSCSTPQVHSQYNIMLCCQWKTRYRRHKKIQYSEQSSRQTTMTGIKGRWKKHSSHH